VALHAALLENAVKVKTCRGAADNRNLAAPERVDEWTGKPRQGCRRVGGGLPPSSMCDASF
jgi:hypothetical protein